MDEDEEDKATSSFSASCSSGCLCSWDPIEVMRLWLRVTGEISRGTVDPSGDERRRRRHLTFVSAVNGLLALLQDAGRAHVDTRNLCPSAGRLAQVIRRCKLQLLALAEKMLVASRRDRFLSDQCLSLSVRLARDVPCGADCARCCPELARRLAKKLGDSGARSIRAVLIDFTEPRMKSECENACSVVTTSSLQAHQRHFKRELATKLRPEWRKCAASNAACLEDADFLSVWREVVSVNSDLGASPAKEASAAAGDFLLPSVWRCAGAVAWRKKLEVLNECLCYGSTLALQSEVPDEACELAQDLLRELGKSGFLLHRFEVDKETILIGRSDEDSSEKMGKNSLQIISLLVFKSVAVVVRQATVCSSGEESDNSHASLGCLGQEEGEAIERNMANILRAWRRWASGTFFQGDDDRHFVDSVMEVFSDQDDGLVEALLCLLDIYSAKMVLAQPQVMHAHSSTNEDENHDRSDEELRERFHPLELFSEFMSRCGWDSSVVVDFLISNETCFLLYLLRLLKFLKKQQHLPNDVGGDLAKMGTFLQECYTSLNKLSEKGLFPYNISPVLELIEKLV